MNATIEYLSAGVIIFLILGATRQYSTNMVYDRINLIEKSVKLEKADKIIDYMLLSPGCPEDWGEGYEEPEAIGLASVSALKLYQLDEEKVRRLSSESMNYIDPTGIRDLLGLSTYYYISIKILPVFNIAVTNYSSEEFSIKVMNEWNVSVPNVDVTAAYVNLNITDVDDQIITSFIDEILDDTIYTNTTDALGSCTILFDEEDVGKTLLVCASQFNVKSVRTWPKTSDSVISTIESSMGSPSLFDVETVYRNVQIDGLNYIVRFSIWS